MDQETEKTVREALEGMEWTDVASESGNISQVGYDIDKGVFGTRFSSGAVYGYAKVPRDKGTQIVEFAPNPTVSTGTQFATHIRKSGYEFIKL